MDNKVSLPEEYFDVNSFNDQENLDGENIDYRIDDPLTLSEDYAMPGETRDIISKPASPTKSYVNNEIQPKVNKEGLDSNNVNNTTNVYQNTDNAQLLN